MSQVRKETVRCPHCLAEGLFDVWPSVNVDLDPGLRKKIFNEELFLYHCPDCGKVTGIPFGTLYHDMTHEFMLFFEFFKPDDFDYAPMEIPKIPLGMDGNYTYRKVYGLMRLNEKIVILEHGLNDIAIEHQKYMISHVIKPEIAEKGHELFFARTEGPNEEFENGKIFFVYNDDETNQTYEVGFAMDNYYEHCLACQLDPRMSVEGCRCIDEGWMVKQMKEE